MVQCERMDIRRVQVIKRVRASTLALALAPVYSQLFSLSLSNLTLNLLLLAIHEAYKHTANGVAAAASDCLLF